jgi:hypothetical protein
MVAVPIVLLIVLPLTTGRPVGIGGSGSTRTPADAGVSAAGHVVITPADAGPAAAGSVVLTSADAGGTAAGSVALTTVDARDDTAGLVAPATADAGPITAGHVAPASADAGDSAAGCVFSSPADAGPVEAGIVDISPADTGGTAAGGIALAPADAGIYAAYRIIPTRRESAVAWVVVIGSHDEIVRAAAVRAGRFLVVAHQQVAHAVNCICCIIAVADVDINPFEDHVGAGQAVNRARADGQILIEQDHGVKLGPKLRDLRLQIRLVAGVFTASAEEGKEREGEDETDCDKS